MSVFHRGKRKLGKILFGDAEVADRHEHYH
jgi:hypothetical protein